MPTCCMYNNLITDNGGSKSKQASGSYKINKEVKSAIPRLNSIRLFHYSNPVVMHNTINYKYTQRICEIFCYLSILKFPNVVLLELALITAR